MVIRTLRRTAFPALLLGLLAACGNKGDLYRDSEAAARRVGDAGQDVLLASREPAAAPPLARR